MLEFGLSDSQSQAILEMQFWKRLTGLEKSKIEVKFRSC